MQCQQCQNGARADDGWTCQAADFPGSEGSLEQVAVILERLLQQAALSNTCPMFKAKGH